MNEADYAHLEATVDALYGDREQMMGLTRDEALERVAYIRGSA